MKLVFRFILISSIALLQSNSVVAQWTSGTVPTWTQVDTLKTEHIYSIAVNSNGYIFIGTKDHGVWRSTDNGLSWVQKIGPPSVYAVWSITIDSSGIYLGTHFAGVYRSTDNGDSWSQIVTASNIDYTSVVIAKDSSILAADGASSSPIIRSSDNGSTWNLSWGATYTAALATNEKFYPSVEHIIYAGGYGTVYYSTDNGASWTWKNAGALGTGSVTSIGSICNFLVTSVSSLFVATSRGGVFESGDYGQTWSPRNTDLTTYFSGYNTYVYCLANDYAATTQPWLLLGTCKGVYWSDNSGGSWYTAGLDTMYVLSIANSSLGNIFVGTDGGGLWYTGDLPLPVNVSSPHPVPTGYSLAQNYPNPFNPSTTIRYRLSAGGYVSLKVYDVLGREVAVLVNAHETAGNHSVKFDGSNIPSGTYFCRLDAGTYHETKKLLLLK